MANILMFQDKADYAAVLEKQGHKVFRFTDQAAALDCGRTQKVDLALVDLTQSGLGVMEELQQIHSDLRWLTVTGSPELGAIRRALTLGAQEILVEPLDLSDLEKKVAKVLKAQKRDLKEALALL
jgi:ActR/RegA family two-component response regulator